MTNTAILGGRIIDPATGLDDVQNLFIRDGFIVALGAEPPGFVADRVVDAHGLVVCPGLVDLSARLREPGYEYRGTLESELEAAVAGGITSLVCPPDTDPPLDEPGLVEMLKYRAKSLKRTHVYPLGALTQKLAGERLTEMAELYDAGCVGFSQGGTTLDDNAVLLHAMDYAATFGFRVWLRPQDASLARNGVAHDGMVSARLGLTGIPVAAETVAIATMLVLARESGARLHICRLSSAEGVAMVARAKEEGLPVTCDVAVHHLHLSEVDIGEFDTHCRVIPPFRSLKDRDALVEGVRRGVVDAICSDHDPMDEDNKVTTFAEAEAGVTGLELLLSLTLRWAQLADVSLLDALARITHIPAGIAGVPAGSLAPGMRADICVFDPEAWWQVGDDTLRSQGRNTPFFGFELPGRVCYTLVGGMVVYQY